MRRLSSTSVTITDPLVKYNALLATGICSPDPAQHRLALHLQKIYLRLKDYSPSVEYQARLKIISNTLNSNKTTSEDCTPTLAAKSHPIWQNPLFARFFARTERKDSLALTRVLMGHEAAISINSPRGIFLSGEVGTGKTMLLDLLADGLPTGRKRRWHFNTFMLYTVSQLERFRTSHPELGNDDQQYSLLWMAKDLIEKSPILFLDEFQLPDRAASKILSNLFTAFFQLGGVLIASSNRMPEELEKATGFEYVPPKTEGLIGQVLGLGKSRPKGELFGSSSDFAFFLEVLKARCEFWQMEGGKDWRRREAELDESNRSDIGAIREEGFISPASSQASNGGVVTILEPETSTGTENTTQMPQHFFILPETGDETWLENINAQALSLEQPIPWTTATLTVYGRTLTIPKVHNGVVYWEFDDLVSSYGPADYITMASTFHTFIVNDVPVLTVLTKNEARRLITLLDALYEARCKLVVRAWAGPDDLFFPEAKAAARSSDPEHELVDADAILPETIAEVYQDQMSPFRPNVSTYTDSANAAYDADQDSDFGVDGKASRLDFSNTGAFTGEDERFAYKRAASRLWELCGAQWHAREGEWWRPLPLDARHWEGSAASRRSSGKNRDETRESNRGDVTMGPSVEGACGFAEIEDRAPEEELLSREQRF